MRCDHVREHSVPDIVNGPTNAARSTVTDDATAIYALAQHAVEIGDEESAIEPLQAHLRRYGGDARAWHWLAMACRGLDRREEALAALDRAINLAAESGEIAKAAAHVRLEAGLPAAPSFLRAISLTPRDPELRLGLASARYAEGDGERALDELNAMLASNHGWYRGHRQYAQLASMMGRAEHSLDTLDRTIAAFPNAVEPYFHAADLLLEADRPADARIYVDRAIAQLGNIGVLPLLDATIEDELQHIERAAERFETLGPARETAHRVRRIRHLIRRGAIHQASLEIEPWLDQEDDAQLWPYASLIWRAMGDSRSDWLHRNGALIRIVDLDAAHLDRSSLSAELRERHERSGRFFNQSVRNGTQTDGPLFARINPVLTHIRELMRLEVKAFAQSLPPADSSHPVLRNDRNARFRFSGSWSVRLLGEGHHSSHHHPEGWLSGVLYVEVPEKLEGVEGHLMLGAAPADLAADVPALQTIAPKPGRLVLFPSWFWHGTKAFHHGERMTIAFDIAHAPHND